MKIENQVVSLELAKRMVELGFRQESYFTWVLRHGRWSVWDEGTMSECETGMEKRKVCAYTVAELGEMMPGVIDKGGKLYYLSPCAGGNGVRAISYVTYRDGVGFFLTGHPVIYEKTEADARAKMLIYLAEQKLIDPNPPTP